MKPNINRLRGLRVEKQLNQAEMAILMDSSPSSYQRIESGQKKILLEEAYKASKILGKSIEEIFFNK